MELYVYSLYMSLWRWQGQSYLLFNFISVMLSCMPVMSIKDFSVIFQISWWKKSLSVGTFVLFYRV